MILPFETLREALTARFGLRIEPEDSLRVHDAFLEQLKSSTLAQSEFIERVQGGKCGPCDLEVLLSSVAVGETHFFRHPAQFQVLALELRAQFSAAEPRNVSVLSAGCSSGEEAYSLAILLHELGLSRCGRVVGFDLLGHSIAKARRGLYSSWSMRGLSSRIHAQYFTRNEIPADSVIRTLVDFQVRNLFQDDPAFWIGEVFDVIFFRNVLMYFTVQAAQIAIERLCAALKPGGLLFLGPAESLRGFEHEFELCQAPGAYFYRKSSRDRVAPQRALSVTPEAVSRAWATSVSTVTKCVRSIITLPDEPASLSNHPPRYDPWLIPPAILPDPTKSVATTPKDPELGPRAFRQARSALDSKELEQGNSRSLDWANDLLQSGRLLEAEALCRTLIVNSPQVSDLRHLLGLCREQAGAVGEAFEEYIAAADADSTFAMPLIQIGLLQKATGNLTASRWAFRRARDLLSNESVERIRRFGSGFSRETLQRVCESELHKHGDDCE